MIWIFGDLPEAKITKQAKFYAILLNIYFYVYLYVMASSSLQLIIRWVLTSSAHSELLKFEFEFEGSQILRGFNFTQQLSNIWRTGKVAVFAAFSFLKLTTMNDYHDHVF